MTLPLAIWTTGSPVAAAAESRGNFFEMIHSPASQQFDGEFLDVQCTGSPTFPDPKSVSGIIVSGSPARLGTQDPWMLETMRALVHAHEVGTPILGICFGHQLLGEALGGSVQANPRGREIGTYSLRHHAADPLLDGIDAHPTIVMTHLDSVVVKPAGAIILRSTELEPHAALRFSETTWGVQFHPEMDAEIIGHYMHARRADIVGEGIDVDKLLEERQDSAFGSLLLRRFARFCAQGQLED